MPPSPPSGDTSYQPSVAILGADTMLAAVPATAVQLAHACLAAGYDTVIPASWGDELVAAGCLRHLATRGAEPAVMCACPLVAERLLGSELTPLLVPLVAPPVACARYLRAAYAPTRIRLTYIGSCPSGSDPAFDAHLSPAELMAQLSALGIVVTEQPLVFESVLPPDRRRFYSMPGGVPAREWLASLPTPRAFVELDAEDCRLQLAEQLLSREQALVDLAPRMGCACSGAVPALPPREARAAVVALEPPRSRSEVVDNRVHVDVDRSLPVGAPDARAERSAPPAQSGAATSAERHARRAGREVPQRERAAPAATHHSSAAPGRHPRRRGGRSRRAAAMPIARAADGRVLPRAYLGRRPVPGTPITELAFENALRAPGVGDRASEPAPPKKRAPVALPPQGAVADPLTH